MLGLALALFLVAMYLGASKVDRIQKERLTRRVALDNLARINAYVRR